METNTKTLTNQYKPKVLYLKFFQAIEESIPGEAVKVVEEMPFSKFSIPVYMHQHSPKDKSEFGKIVQVGFIKNYNKETRTFTVVIFNSSKRLIGDKLPELKVECGEFNGEFTKVNRIILNF